MKNIDIYGTIGPACAKPERLGEMFRLGMTGIRLNLSHTELADCREWTDMIRDVSRNAGIQPRLLVDLNGPELRVQGMEEPLNLTHKRIINLGTQPGDIPVPEMIFPYLKPGQEILLDDGKIQLEVADAAEQCARCFVVRSGVLQPRKSIALPGISLDLPTLTESDKENIRAAKSHGVTGVMLPFVRDAEDLKNLKQELLKADAADIEVFAKIENMDGVRNLEQLLPYADHMVIARGDLGNNMPLWELPVIQAQIAEKCRKAGKPFMVVTQMLASMETREVPTRAEVSDIFGAVAQGASSVMVTGETAVGKYPAEVIRYLANTVKAAAEYINASC